MKQTQVMAGSALAFIAFLAFCSFSLDQQLFEYYEQVLHSAHQNELQRALGLMLTPNVRPGSMRPKHIEDVQNAVKVMFTSLPKNQAGRISVDVMRYMAHRYFSDKYGWVINGFESENANSSISEARILRSQVPEYCQRVLEGSLATTGFSFQDAAMFVAGVEQLIFDEVASSTELAYHVNDLQVTTKLSQHGLLDVIYSFMVESMVAGNFSDAKQHKVDKTQIDELYPHWHETQLFIDDVIRADDKQSKGKNLFRGSKRKYTFEETVGLTTRISEEFGPWANYECANMKTSMSQWDVQGTGRVKLADFWRNHKPEDNDTPILYESSEYLRKIGALDDSDASLGPQVIIPNYVYSTANCVLTTSHYSVCCLNECNSMLHQLEARFQAPEASASDILIALEENLVNKKFTAHHQALNGTLGGKLLEIAAQNADGMVPIHGRLFAQWLHYVFPRDCPYPHEVGAVMQMLPHEWAAAAGGYNASDPQAEHPTVAEESELQSLQQKPESLLPPARHAGWKMWVSKEHLLISSTASDKWATLFLQFLAGMILGTGLLLSMLKSFRHNVNKVSSSANARKPVQLSLAI